MILEVDGDILCVFFCVIYVFVKFFDLVIIVVVDVMCFVVIKFCKVDVLFVVLVVSFLVSFRR